MTKQQTARKNKLLQEISIDLKIIEKSGLGVNLTDTYIRFFRFRFELEQLESFNK